MPASRRTRGLFQVEVTSGARSRCAASTTRPPGRGRLPAARRAGRGRRRGSTRRSASRPARSGRQPMTDDDEIAATVFEAAFTIADGEGIVVYVYERGHSRRRQLDGVDRLPGTRRDRAHGGRGPPGRRGPAGHGGRRRGQAVTVCAAGSKGYAHVSGSARARIPRSHPPVGRAGRRGRAHRPPSPCREE